MVCLRKLEENYLGGVNHCGILVYRLLEFPWNSQKFLGIPWSSVEFREILRSSLEFHGIPQLFHIASGSSENLDSGNVHGISTCARRSEHETEIYDGILDVEDEDSNMPVKKIIEHDTNDTAATSALDIDEILDMTNIASIKKDLSLKDFSGWIIVKDYLQEVCL
ncbi:hypothetical protein JTB14_003242 [Gonioctena quinquepunctata]|nr:hypothetical protein JTB14_003242 [Gonioctena quinquepunctata]